MYFRSLKIAVYNSPNQQQHLDYISSERVVTQIFFVGLEQILQVALEMNGCLNNACVQVSGTTLIIALGQLNRACSNPAKCLPMLT